MLYKEMSDLEKKEFYHTLIERIDLYPEYTSEGRLLKHIEFKFPVSYDAEEDKKWLINENNVETVCLLSQQKPDDIIRIGLDLSALDITASEKKATYEEIQSYVLEHTGLKVSHLYIAQVKQKHGIIERENYNKPKSEDSKQPQCPPEKEAAITEALKYFKMI